MKIRARHFFPQNPFMQTKRRSNKHKIGGNFSLTTPNTWRFTKIIRKSTLAKCENVLQDLPKKFAEETSSCLKCSLKSCFYINSKAFWWFGSTSSKHLITTHSCVILLLAKTFRALPCKSWMKIRIRNIFGEREKQLKLHDPWTSLIFWVLWISSDRILEILCWKVNVLKIMEVWAFGIKWSQRLQCQ